ncbi:MAG: FAD/NAD(P)-binding oxidoreductase [Anaerolineales bacterium]|jgi:3-phenylpropionate/trans-cinnamate dioxygenase ferredoxin reductase subunit
MISYKYLIVGGGLTAAGAVEGIRSVDKQGEIGMISAEAHPPYVRPLLSKGLWMGKPLDKVWRDISDQGVVMHLGRQVNEIDPQEKRVRDADGDEFGYEKLLLATGGTPRKLPFGDERILYFRTLNDYHELRKLTGLAQKFGVIGGGFIGSELAAALRMNDQQVVMVFPEDGIGALVYPHDLSQFISDYYRDKGIEVRSGELLAGVQEQDQAYQLQTKAGEKIQVDHVVAGIGIRPNVDLAKSVGIQVEDGILVDEYLQTNLPDIYAAGDVASFYNPALDKRMRVEHEDNANTMGKYAGQNMAGERKAYHYLPFFYSDLFDLGYEAVGELNSELETVSDWKEPFRKGVVYYLQEGRVRGVLLWNTWGKVDAARELINSRQQFTAEELKGKIG